MCSSSKYQSCESLLEEALSVSLFKTYIIVKTRGSRKKKLRAMAVGMGAASEGGQYSGKMTPFVVLSCMMAAMGGVLFGYDIGISGQFLILHMIFKTFFTLQKFMINLYLSMVKVKNKKNKKLYNIYLKKYKKKLI